MQHKLAILVCHHLDVNRSYLGLCLDSLNRSTYENADVFVIADSETEPVAARAVEKVRLTWDRSLNTSVKKVNHFLDHLPAEYTHTLLLGDDTIVSSHAIGALMGMATTAEDEVPLIVNPMSNSDCRSTYFCDLKLGGETMVPDMTEISADTIQAVHDFKGLADLLINVERLSFYATLMSRSVWRHVGRLDENLEYRFNDWDFCMRAQQLNIPRFIYFGAFVFHFGSRTLNLDPEIEAKKAACAEHFTKKWGFQ